MLLPYPFNSEYNIVRRKIVAEFAKDKIELDDRSKKLLGLKSYVEGEIEEEIKKETKPEEPKSDSSFCLLF